MNSPSVRLFAAGQMPLTCTLQIGKESSRLLLSFYLKWAIKKLKNAIFYFLDDVLGEV